MVTKPSPNGNQAPSASPDPAEATATRDSLSENLLSQSAGDAEDDDTFSVAEEVSLDQQSAQVRRVGQAPDGASTPGTTTAPDAMAEALRKPDTPA